MITKWYTLFIPGTSESVQCYSHEVQRDSVPCTTKLGNCNVSAKKYQRPVQNSMTDLSRKLFPVMRGDPLTSQCGVRQNSVLGKNKNGSHFCYSSGETSSEGASTDKGERKVLSGYTIPKLGPASSGYAFTRSKVQHNVVTTSNLINQSNLAPTGSLQAQTSIYASTRSKVHHTVHSLTSTHNSIDRQPDHTTAMQSKRKGEANLNFDVCSRVSSTPPSATCTFTQSTVVQVQRSLSPSTQDSDSLPSHTATRSQSEKILRDPCLPTVHDSSALPHNNAKLLSDANDSKGIIRRTLDKYFDRGELTNRQYKRILERANQKVQKGIDQSSYMNEKRVVKLVGDYVKAYMYHENDEGPC